jgi:hypothetical protein
VSPCHAKSVSKTEIKTRNSRDKRAKFPRISEISTSGTGGSTSADVLPHSPYISEKLVFAKKGSRWGRSRGGNLPLQFVLRLVLPETVDECILLQSIHIMRPNISLEIKDANHSLFERHDVF